MKHNKLYNLIFPIWIFLFFSPVILLTLVGNFIIDSLVLIASFYVFKVADNQIMLGTYYKKHIFRVWIFGFIADIIGAIILLVISISSDKLSLPNKLIYGINYDPFSHVGAILIIIFAMLVSGFFIFLFNYKFTLKKMILNVKLRFKIAIFIAIITIPWTFLLPTKWFYN